MLASNDLPCSLSLGSWLVSPFFILFLQNSNTGWQRLVLLLVQDGDGARGPGDHRRGKRAGGEDPEDWDENENDYVENCYIENDYIESYIENGNILETSVHADDAMLSC